MKIGLRKRSFKKSFKAMTTGRIKRKLKSTINPLYGKKNMGLIKNPERAIKNKIYHKTTIGLTPSSFPKPKKSTATRTKVEIDMEVDDDAVYMWSALMDNSCKLCKALDGKVFTAEQVKELKKQPGSACEHCNCTWVKLTGPDKPKPDYKSINPLVKND